MFAGFRTNKTTASLLGFLASELSAILADAGARIAACIRHGKLDELLRVHGKARTEVTNLDQHSKGNRRASTRNGPPSFPRDIADSDRSQNY
jgi:hypothetical protein